MHNYFVNVINMKFIMLQRQQRKEMNTNIAVTYSNAKVLHLKERNIYALPKKKMRELKDICVAEKKRFIWSSYYEFLIHMLYYMCVYELYVRRNDFRNCKNQQKLYR